MRSISIQRAAGGLCLDAQLMRSSSERLDAQKHRGLLRRSIDRGDYLVTRFGNSVVTGCLGHPGTAELSRLSAANGEIPAHQLPLASQPHQVMACSTPPSQQDYPAHTEVQS
jgi:hypothetical protein